MKAALPSKPSLPVILNTLLSRNERVHVVDTISPYLLSKLYLMDWSSVYEENGNESGDFNRTNVVAISVRTSVLDLLQVYNPYICYAFTVNYILGVGCLGIPYAFYQSGIILGSSLIIFLSFISYTAVMWIAETSHRGMQLRLDSHSKNPFKSLKLMKWKKTSATENTGCVLNFGRMLLQPTIYETQQVLNSNGRDHGVCTGSKMGGKWSSRNSVMRAGSGLQIEKESLVKSVDNEGSLSVINLYSSISQLTFDGQQDIRKDSWGSSKHPQCIQDDSRTQSSSLRPNGLLDSSSRFLGRGRSNTADETDADCLDFSELEVTELTLEILGPQGCILYQMALAVLTYVGLLAYTQVFVQSFVSQIWPAAPAFLPNLLFGFVVIPLSCFDLAEQIIVQVVMSLLRFVALGSLFGITLMAIFQNKSSADSPGQFRNFANLVPDGSQWNGRQSAYNTPLCNLSGFGVMFTTAIFR